MYKVKFHSMMNPYASESDLGIDTAYYSTHTFNGGSSVWNNYYEVVDTNASDYDFVVIYNMPHPKYSFDPKKAIFVYTETNIVLDSWSNVLYGDNRYYPPKMEDTDFFRVFDIERNRAFSCYAIPDINADFQKYTDHLGIFITEKNFYPGHKKRLKFINNFIEKYEYCDRLFTEEPEHVVDYEKVKLEGKFKNLKTFNVYDEVFHHYKYIYNCENGWGDNYITEKLITPIFYNCLTFYSGSNTASKHIDPICFIEIDIDPDNFKDASDLIIQNIYDREWEKRAEKIKKYRYTLFQYCNILKYIELIIRDII